MNRAVRRGSKGIAIMDASSGAPQIRYVFDISDTVGRDKSRRPYLWELREDNQDAVLQALSDQYDISTDMELEWQLEAIASTLAEEYWQENQVDILAGVGGSFLEELDEGNIKAGFCEAAATSTLYVLLTRCGLDADQSLKHEDFLSVFDFNTPAMAAALGTAVSKNSEQVLRQIEVAIKNFERSRAHGRVELSAGRGLPAAGVGDGGSPTTGQVRDDAAGVSPGASPGAVQSDDSQRDTGPAPGGDRPDSGPAVGVDDTAVAEIHGDNRADESVRPDEVGGPDEQLQAESGGNDPDGVGIQLTPVDFSAAGLTGLPFSHRTIPSDVLYYEDREEKKEIIRKSDALKKRLSQVSHFFTAHEDKDERTDHIKKLFDSYYTEVILDSGQRAGYRAYEDALCLWRGAYLTRDREDYLPWEAVAAMIAEMIEHGEWLGQEQVTIQMDEPAPQEDGYIPTLFDLAGSTIPLTRNPAEKPDTPRPLVSQDVIDEALRIGANDTASRLRIVAEFMKGKSTEENTQFLQSHYGENGAGFFVGERKYALWYNEAGMKISLGEGVNDRLSTTVTWEQAAQRIKELLEAGEYAGQVMLYRAWPFERRRIAEDLQYLHRDITEEYKNQYLPTLTAALGKVYVYPDVVDKTKDLLDQPEQLRAVIREFEDFVKDYAHNRDILRFRNRHTDEILQSLKDLQLEPVKFTAAEDFVPQRRLFISQDEIDDLLRDHPDRNEYRIGVYKFFETHPDKKEREQYLGHLHGEYSGYGGGNDSITYTPKHLTFSHGSVSEPYAKVELKWPQVRKRIEELIAHDSFLSAEDKEIMENRELEIPAETATPLDHAKELIEEFCQSEFDVSADFSDLSRVGIGYTTTGDGEHEIQVYADLTGFRLLYELDWQTVISLQCHDLDDLNEYLATLDFEQIVAYAEEQYLRQKENAPRYQVTVYHPTENGFDEKLEYQTREEAEEIAQKYVDGTMEEDGFQYEGAAVFDLQERQWVFVAGYFPVLDGGRELPHLPYKVEERQDVVPSPTVGELYEKYKAQIVEALAADEPYRNACRNSDKDNAYTEGEAAIKRAVLAANDTTLTKLYFDNSKFHNDLHREALDETYPRFSQIEHDTLAAEPLTDLQKKAMEIASGYEKLPLQGKIDVIAQAFGCTTGKIETSPCSGKWRGNSDISIRFDNGLSLGIGNEPTPQAKTKKAQNKYIQSVLVRYNPEIVRLTKETALAVLKKKEAMDNAIAAEKGLKPYTVLTVELHDGAEDIHTGYLGWYYVTLAIDGKIFAHLETGLSYEIAEGKVSEMPTREKYFVAGALKPEGVDFVFNNVGFSSTASLYTLPLGSTVRERAEKELAQRNITPIAEAPFAENPTPASDNTHVPKRDPLAPAYKTGDTVYLDGTAFTITEIGLHDVHLQDPTLAYPVFRAESKERFEEMLLQDERNSGIIEFLSAPPRPDSSAQHSYTTKTEAIYRAEKNNLPFDVVIETLHFDEPEQAHNFRITDENLGAGGAKAKYQMNMDAINVLRQLQAEGRQATPDEQETLSKYVGWGALPDAFDETKASWASEYKELKEALTPEEYNSARGSVLNAHYTRPTVIRAMYQALEKMGFQGGNILEPSCGAGNFFGCLPESMAGSKLYGVELDELTGQIAQQLYPQADIRIAGFESTNRRNFYDVAIGNVPFGNYQVHDPAYDKLGFSIHNYFFAKALDQVRPGGVVAFLTSRYTMDSKDTSVRKYLAERADLLGAIRLPNGTFRANAGTEAMEDIVFLQKRETPNLEEPAWVQTGETALGFTINQYFLENPHMVLGEEISESTQYGTPGYAVRTLPGADLDQQLAAAITHIRGEYREAELPDLEADEPAQETLPADPDVKNFSYTIIKGDVYYRQNSIMVKKKLGKTAAQRVTGLVGLRDCVRKLINQQLNRYTTDESIRQTQAELDRLYDDFAVKFGRINDQSNRLAFSEDSSYYLLCALEVLDDEGRFLRKADMFTKRTIMPHIEVTHVDTATEALAVSIGERARVDISFMAELTGKGEDEVINELQGQIYRVPLQNPPVYVTADEYLSGNVRQKLAVAQAVAKNDTSFQINVNALAEVQPKDLDASEIDVRLGATWVDPKYIEQFMYEFLEMPVYLRHQMRVTCSSIDYEWKISNKSAIGPDDVLTRVTYGTSRAGAYRLLEDALNLRDTRIFDTVEGPDGKEKRVLNSRETMLAQEKQSLIKQGFKDWIFRDPERRQTLVRKYNDEMNCIRPREYDGSHLVLAGMNPEIQLEEHQKNAIARAIYGGNTLFAHCVGAGKTFEITATAMESKRLGLCSKSMIVVPNHLTQQWASEFLTLYPNANILVITKRDFERDRRKKFCARIASGDYDAVIIGYSQFEKIPISKERQERLLRREISEIMGSIIEAKAQNGQRFTVKDMERKRKSLEARLEKLQAEERKDDVVSFEELGVDRLFVDESDCFKNLFFVTKMNNVAGLSNTESQRASDMFMKTRYLDEITDSKGVVFATGTPISNSIAEMYTVQRYLQYETLQAMGMGQFDSWASRFGETVTAMELAPEGTGYRPRTRFAKFYNLPELMNIFHEVADIKTSDQLNLPTPEVVYHNEVAQPSEYQKEYMKELSARATAIRERRVDSKEDNMLVITNDGRKLGLDQRLLDPQAGDDPGSKVNLCVENVLKIWREGAEKRLTQLIFCDSSTPKKNGEFNVYDDIKSKLIAQGVPKNEVAFIHDADSDMKKKELFRKVRSGKVRVLLGSTEKLGAGTNVQDRLIALHNLDCPWRPRDLTQREGRIKRRGNQNSEVHIFRYVTENTFDSYLWQTVEKKQQFIGQIMTSKSPVRSCEDVDDTALDYAEIKALCAGDPRIKERMELDMEVAKLKIMQASYQSQMYRLEDKVRLVFPKQQADTEQRIADLQEDMATAAAHPEPADSFAGMDVCGQTCKERVDAAALLEQARQQIQPGSTEEIGFYRGFKLCVRQKNFLSEPEFLLRGRITYSIECGDSALGSVIKLENSLKRLPAHLDAAKKELENVEQQFASAKAELGKPFPQEQELKDKLARIKELDEVLQMEDSAPVVSKEEKDVEVIAL